MPVSFGVHDVDYQLWTKSVCDNEGSLFIDNNALFVSTLTFFGKWFIFQRVFSRKLSHFPVFGNDLENELENVFGCLYAIFF